MLCEPTSTLVSTRTAAARRPLALIGVALVAVLWVAILYSHAQARRPWNDEAMLSTPSLNLIEKGYPGTSAIEASRLPNLNRYTYWAFPLNIAVLAGWFKMVGFSLLALRVASMLWTAVLVLEIFLLARKWSGSEHVALLASLLAAFDYHILLAGSFGRYDPLVAALGFGGYAAYLLLREKHLRIALLAANALVAACGMTHPNGLMFLVGLVFLVLYHDRRSLRVSDVALCAVPYVIGGVAWGAYILQDPHAAISQLTTNSYSRVSLFQPLAAIRGEIGRYAQAAGLTQVHSAGSSGPIALKSLPWIVYLAGLLMVVGRDDLRTHPGIRAALWLTLVHFLYQCFFEGMKFPYYLEHIIPLYAIILAVALHHGWTRSLIPRPLLALMAATVILIGIGGMAQRIRINTYRNFYLPAVEFVQQTVPPSSLVMASCDFGFAYGFRPNLVDDIRLGYDSGKVPQFIVVEESYRDNFQIWKVTEPALYRFIVNRLHEYAVVYDRNTYRVYRRRDDVAPQTGIPSAP